MRSHSIFRSYLAAFLCGLIACLPASAATLTYAEGTTIIFNPSATLSGLNVGAIAGDPSAPVNGDIWYDSTANELTARINGANVALGSGGSGSGNALTTDPLSQFAATTSAQLKGVLSDELGDASGKAIFALGTLAISSGKTLTSSNTLTLAGTDGSTLNIGAGGTLGAAALLGTSAGGNGAADNGKAVIFGTGGILDATTELTVHHSATAAHAYFADDATIGYHAVGETNPRELAFPSDVLEGESKEIATKNWVNAQGFGGTLTATYVGYGDGANALTGEAAMTYTAASDLLTVPNLYASTAIELGAASDTTLTRSAAGSVAVEGVSVPTISSTSTLTNKRITDRVATLTDAATVTLATDSYDGGILTTLSQTTDFANPTGTPTELQSYVLRIKSTTTRALTWGTQFRGGVDIALPTATTGSSKTDYFKFTWNVADSKWDIMARAMGY